MLSRGASAGRALARSAASPRTAAVAAGAASARAASSITIGAGGVLNVPNDPIVPFIEARGCGRQRCAARARAATAAPRLTRRRDRPPQGDGTGPDIWRAAKHVLDSAVRGGGRVGRTRAARRL
jgi:hypothetical protein